METGKVVENESNGSTVPQRDFTHVAAVEMESNCRIFFWTMVHEPHQGAGYNRLWKTDGLAATFALICQRLSLTRHNSKDGDVNKVV